MPEIDKIKIKETTYDIKDTTARNQGLPSGGTTGQFLKKISNTNYDTEWGNISTSWGDITGTLSDQTDLQEALDNKADVIINSASGAIVSISDAKASPVVGLSVGIEAVQDLHGYSNPWPAGGGKNIIDYTKGYTGFGYNTAVGTIITPVISETQPTTTSNVITFTGGAWSALTFLTKGLSTGTYHVHMNLTENSGSRMTIYVVDGTTNEILTTTASTSAIVYDSNQTISKDGDYIAVTIASNVEGTRKVSDLQVENGNAYSSWAPYENICPISGHTETVVTRTGKNLLNHATSTEGYRTDNVGGITASANYSVSDYMMCRYNEELYLDHVVGSQGGYTIWMYDIDKNPLNYINIYGGADVSGSKTINEQNARWMRISYPTAQKDAVQVSIGSTASAYEPYQGVSLTISLGQTVYGGTMDVLTGTMTVTKVYATLDDPDKWGLSSGSTLTYVYNQNFSDRKKFSTSMEGYICSAFPSNAYPRGQWNGSTGIAFGVRDPDSKITLDTIKAMASAGQIAIVYELATPIVITGLTPATLSLLYGNNTVWADTRDINIQYKIDTKEYIDNSRTYYVKGTQTASTGNWTGDLLQIKELYEGLAIDYWLPFAGSGNATLTLTLKNGTTDPIPVYYGGTTRVTTTQPVNTVWRYVYQTVEISNVEYTGWWAVRAYDSNTTYNYFSNLVHNRGKFVADSDIYRYNILFHIDDDTLTPLNNANNVTATTKTMLTNVTFDPFAEIFYYGSSGSFSANGEVAASYLTWNYENVDLRYTLNSGSTLTADKYIYLKVIMQSDGKCKLASDPCWTQTLPSTADGYHYIFLGRAHSTTSISFYYYHPIFYHDGTSIKIMQNPKIAGSGGGTWGSISGTLSNQTDLQAALDGKISKSGDTMSDSLGFNSLSTNINGTAPLSNTYGDEINFKDNTDYQLGRIQTAHYTDGSVALQLGIKRTNGNNEVNNVFEIKLDSQYNKTYYIHEPANFRSALGLTGIAIRPDYIISSVDLIDGVSELESGKLYFYYEA